VCDCILQHEKPLLSPRAQPRGLAADGRRVAAAARCLDCASLHSTGQERGRTQLHTANSRRPAAIFRHTSELRPRPAGRGWSDEPWVPCLHLHKHVFRAKPICPSQRKSSTAFQRSHSDRLLRFARNDIQWPIYVIARSVATKQSLPRIATEPAPCFVICSHRGAAHTANLPCHRFVVSARRYA